MANKECELRRGNGMPGADCDEDECIYWRVVGHLDVAEHSKGCAVQYFELSGESPEIAAWLLSVKERVENRKA